MSSGLVAYETEQSAGSLFTACKPAPLVGVDTLRLSHEADPEVCRELAGTGRRVSPNAYRIFLGGSQHAHIDVVSPFLCLETSLPKVALGSNVEALPLDQAMDTARMVFAWSQEILPWVFEHQTLSFDDLRVARIDLVRDFQGIVECHALLNALQDEAYRRGYPLERHIKRGETLSVVRKRWKATLYDKWTESFGLAPEGQLRYETTLRREHLTSEWAATLAGKVYGPTDLADGRLATMAESMFHKVGFGVPIDSYEALPIHVAQAGFRGIEAAKVMGLKLDPSVLDPKSTTAVKWRPLAAKIPNPAGGISSTMALDYASGRLVCA